jgi:hypothetical protein
LGAWVPATKVERETDPIESSAIPIDDLSQREPVSETADPQEGLV